MNAGDNYPGGQVPTSSGVTNTVAAVDQVCQQATREAAVGTAAIPARLSVEAVQAPTPLRAGTSGSARRRGRAAGHVRSSMALLLAADGVVLAGYLLAQPIWWRAYVGLWLTTVVSFHSRGIYRPRLYLSVLDDLPTLVRRNLLSIALVGVVVGRLRGGHAVNTFVIVAFAGMLGHLAVRAVVYGLIRWARRTGWVGYRTLVVGGGAFSHRIVCSLDEHPDYGLNVLGYVDELPSPIAHGPVGWVQLGYVDDLLMVVRRLQIEVVVVGYGVARDIDTATVLRDPHGPRPSVLVVPRLFEVGGRWAMQDRIGAIPVIRLRPAQLTGVRWRLKRAFDVAVAGIALVALSPVLAAVALAVRGEGGPGVIFRQIRVGREGQLFEVLKFRSMRPADPGESDVRWSIARDDRVGPVGRFIRRTSLDELPQLFNILRGDMTIVGPRPERPHFVEQFSGALPHYGYRHRVPVGLTGLAQVSGLRGDTSIDERARYDNYYIENWSLWLDIKVILRTVRQVIRAAGA
jgi:exopolysaccharide biosynthesis polyprenyl glycosylphosphotransferase